MTSRPDKRPASPSATWTRSAASRSRPAPSGVWEDRTLSTPTPTASAAAATPVVTVGRYRWVVVALLFTAMIINYVDRQTLGFLKGDLSKAYGWNETNY